MTDTPRDWLGNEITAGTRVLWRQTGKPPCRWSLGTVVAVRRAHDGQGLGWHGPLDEFELDIAWDLRQRYAQQAAKPDDGIGKNIIIGNVMVWPDQAMPQDTRSAA